MTRDAYLALSATDRRRHNVSMAVRKRHPDGTPWQWRSGGTCAARGCRCGMESVPWSIDDWRDLDRREETKSGEETTP